ncbi:hypothetical protein SAMN04487926_12255 [Paraburkholderia steynii]|uniref:Uncharacterized protein n=1 Tax=Paraburkholderia steynii TaxID=1245441 RepID=A0A7Z7BCB5_9BURK|nr:hypothetical protein [Paraburkholderia steynii]SDI70586.1 hypothetical protein SAMN04487926_12255 [Paraburkholderia steynii]
MSSPAGSATDRYWKQQFEFLLVEPVVWALDADSLMRSFDIIAQVAESDLAEKVRQMTTNVQSPATYVPEIGRNALMLGALAVEVLLKGIALTNQSVATSVKAKDRQTTKRLLSHNIRDIAQLAGVQLTAPEAGLCERLETFLVWAGRYSIPKSHTEMMPRPLVMGGIAPPNIYSSADFQAVRSLTSRLRLLLPAVS